MEEVNQKAIQFLIEEDSYPSGIGFMGFENAISVAPNDILCHGIPNDRLIQGRKIK